MYVFFFRFSEDRTNYPVRGINDSKNIVHGNRPKYKHERIRKIRPADRSIIININSTAACNYCSSWKSIAALYNVPDDNIITLL